MPNMQRLRSAVSEGPFMERPFGLLHLRWARMGRQEDSGVIWQELVPLIERLRPDHPYQEVVDLGRTAEWWREGTLRLAMVLSTFRNLEAFLPSEKRKGYVRKTDAEKLPTP